MHAYNGNPILRLAFDNNELIAHVQLQLSSQLDFNNSYSRTQLLNVRVQQAPDSEVILPVLQTTTPDKGLGHSHKKNTKQRSGRRIRIPNQEGGYVNYKNRPIKNSTIIQEFNSKLKRRTPPPRGAPGPDNRDYEEWPRNDKAKGLSRGTIGRRLRRRAYRKWCRESRKEHGTGLGPPSIALSQPKQASQSRAKWFRQSLYWQEKEGKAQKLTDHNASTV